jgi:hypothetical protein
MLFELTVGLSHPQSVASWLFLQLFIFILSLSYDCCMIQN